MPYLKRKWKLLLFIYKRGQAPRLYSKRQKASKGNTPVHNGKQKRDHGARKEQVPWDD